MAISLLFCSTSVFAQSTAPTTKRTQTIEIKIPTELWPGWESGKIDEDPQGPATRPADEQYVAFPTPAGTRQSFSGKVIGLSSYDNVEVAIISVFPREYFSHDALTTAGVRADGSFAMISREHPERLKTICVRAPGYPWTYLNHDFAVNESGRDIVIKVEPGKLISITAESMDNPQKGWTTLEAFDGYQRHDRDGKLVQSEYYGGRDSNDGNITLLLPLRPMALRIRAEGSANSFVIADPREVDQLTVELPREAKLKARVTTGGQPMPFKPVWFFNPAARLSWGGVETDGQGRFELAGLMPGSYFFMIGDQHFTSSLRQGRVNDVSFDVKP